MNTFSIFELIFFIFVVSINLLLTFTVYVRNPKSITNKIFSLLGVVVSIWLIVFYFSLSPNDHGTSLFLIRLSICLASLMSLLFLLLSHTLPRKKFTLNKNYFIVLLLFTLLTMLISLSPFSFIDVVNYNNFPQPIPGPGLILFAAFILITTADTIYILFRRLITTHGMEKQQVRYIMLGIILMYSLLILTVLVPVSLFKINSFVQFAPFYTLLFLIMASYAIVKHRFLDIGLVVARSVTYSLILVVIGGLYTVYFLVTGSIIFKVPFSLQQFVFYGVVMFIVAFTFQPVRSILERITDAVFYRGHYNQQKLLEALSKIMSETIDLKTLTASILDKVLPEMRITRGVFVLLKKHDHGYIDYIEYKGYDKSPIFTKGDIEPFLKDNIIMFEDLEEGELKTEMRKINVSVALPLRVQAERIGVLFFSEKASGDIYSQQDINVLEILAPQLSVAIQNSKEYEEIKMFNITLKKEIEIATKDLKEANERLKSLDKLKDEFVSLASHELRTPMTVVKQYLWMVIAGREGPLNDKQKTFLDRAYQSTEELLALVNDMLDVSRIEANKITLELKPLSITDTVTQLVSELSPRSQELGVPVQIADHEEIPKVIADSGKLKEVLTNLLGNSLKYTPRGGSITISFSKKEGMVEVGIKDTGVGIKPEDLPKLFQKFGRLEQGKELTRERLESTGLGLYIVKSIVELHGGKIWVESEGENKGSTFSFALPEDTEENRKKIPPTTETTSN